MQTNQASLDQNISSTYPMLLVEQVTNQVFQIYPITGLETSYFPKFMKCFWSKYPGGRILSDTELLELCFDTVDSILEEQKITSSQTNVENEASTGVDQDLVLNFLFQPSEIVSASREDLLRFPKKRDYSCTISELIVEVNLNEETFEKYLVQHKINRKHLNRLSFPNNTNYSNINNFITHLSCVCGFLFSDPLLKTILFRSLYYIFFKKVSTLNEDSILLFVGSPDKKKKPGWICLDFSMSFNTIGYIINFEESYVFDFRDHRLLPTNQIIDKKEFLKVEEKCASSQIEAQVLADKIKQKTHELHMNILHPDKYIAEPNFILNQIEQLSLLQETEHPTSIPSPAINQVSATSFLPSQLSLNLAQEQAANPKKTNRQIFHFNDQLIFLQEN